MQPSTSFDWGRVVTPLRWVAGIIAGGAFVIWVGFVILSNLGGESSQAIPVNTVQVVVWGLYGIGLVAAVFWKGIGEIVGGLLLFGGAVVFIVAGVLEFGLQLGALTAVAPFAAPGLLFIVCGWYTLAKARHHAPHAIA